MKHTVTINGVTVSADQFGWDGCHKIYLITSEAGMDDMIEFGYTLFPVGDLQEVWDLSCGLRFIDDADLCATYVSQMDEDEPLIKVWQEVA